MTQTRCITKESTQPGFWLTGDLHDFWEQVRDLGAPWQGKEVTPSLWPGFIYGKELACLSPTPWGLLSQDLAYVWPEPRLQTTCEP